MSNTAPIWIFQSEFGRATVNLTDKALVEHAHQQFNILFKLGGADAVFKSGAQSLALDDNSVLLFNPWVPHLKLANVGGPTMILSLIIEGDWIGRLLERQGTPLGQLFPNPREQITEDVRLNAERVAAAILAPGTVMICSPISWMRLRAPMWIRSPPGPDPRAIVRSIIGFERRSTSFTSTRAKIPGSMTSQSWLDCPVRDSSSSSGAAWEPRRSTISIISECGSRRAV
jgi:hypothetical protein